MNEQKIKCEANFKEIKEQNAKFESSINVKFDYLSNVLCKRIDEHCENVKEQLTESMNEQLECRISDIKNEMTNKVEKQITEQCSVINTIVEKQMNECNANTCLLYTSRCV